MLKLNEGQKQIAEIIVAKAVEQDGKLIINNPWSVLKGELAAKELRIKDGAVNWAISRLQKQGFLVKMKKGVYEVRRDLLKETKTFEIKKRVKIPANEKEKQDKDLLEQGYRVMQARLGKLQEEKTALEKRIETTTEAIKIMALMLKIW